MLKNTITLWSILLLLLPMSGFSGTLQNLAAKFGNDLKNTDVKIAVMDFSGGEAGDNQDSIVVRERITTFLAQNKNITLIERALLEKVFQEQKIQVSGAVGTDTAKKIGELTGANAIVSGTLTELPNDGVELNARIIEVGTGKVISAGQAVFKKDWKYFKPLVLNKDEKVAENSAQDYYQQGVKYHIHAKYNMALEFYTKAIKLKPDYPEAYFGRGSIYAYPAGLVEGDNAKAIDDFSKAINLKIDYTGAYFSRAMTYRAMAEGIDSADPKSMLSDYGKAISDLSKAIELTPISTTTAIDCEVGFIPNYPDYIGNYLQRGAIYKARGTVFNPDNFLQGVAPDLRAAIEDYNKGIEQLPNCAEMYSSRGSVYKAIPDYAEAIFDYSKAIDLSTDTTSNYIARGDTYYAKSDYDSAIIDYTKAIGLRTAHNSTVVPPGLIPRWEDTKPIDPIFSSSFIPDDSIFISRGNAYYMKTDYSKAIADYSKAVELAPGNSRAYAYRGNAYRAQGKKDKAISDYTKSIELGTMDSKVYADRGEFYYDEHELDKAIADFDKAIELNPRDAYAYFIRGSSYQGKGEDGKAVFDYTTALELDPTYNNLVYARRGSSYVKIGEVEKALSDLNKAIEINPKDWLSYCSRGMVYLAQSDYEKAIIDCNSAIKLNPHYARAYALRGLAYKAKGDLTRAKNDAKKSEELKKKD